MHAYSFMRSSFMNSVQRFMAFEPFTLPPAHLQMRMVSLYVMLSS